MTPRSIVDVWFLSLVDGIDVDEASSSLSVEELRRAERFATDELRARWINGRVGLRRILAGYLSISPSRVPISYRSCTACGDSHGKPVVTGSDLAFNLSRTKRLAALAVTSGGEVGIDLESFATDRLDGTAQLWLSSRELEVLDRVAPAERQRRLLRWWTAKEAAVKWSGEGLNRDLRQVEVVDAVGGVRSTVGGASLAPLAERGLISTIATTGARRWCLHWWDGGADAAR